MRSGTSDTTRHPRRRAAYDAAMARVGILTGGGDCPGLNAVIRAVVRKGVNGARPRDRRLPLRLGGRARRRDDGARRSTARAGILPRGGTILGIVAHEPVQGGRRRSTRVHGDAGGRGVDALIAIGGEDTLGVARRLHEAGVARGRACPRRSTTTSPPPTSRSASRPRCRSPPTRSTACTRRPRPTTG